MIAQAIVTYLHYASFIVLFTSLTIEAVLFRKNITESIARTIARVDAWYGLASIMVLATGFSKMFMFGKGILYYTHNYLLWGKIGLFTVVGLLSVYPTVYFLRWRKQMKNGESVAVTEKDYRLISKLILIEIFIASLIPLLAVFMARGFGVFS